MKRSLTKTELRTVNASQNQTTFSKASAYVKGLLLTAAALAFGLFNGVAAAAVTIPDTGVDMDEWVTAAITGLGAIVAVVIGGYFAFKLIKIALRWVGKIGS